MTVRAPFRAGSFYEASEDACRQHAETLIAEASLPQDLPDTLYGGLVPHAGWAFSGRLAAMTLKALLGEQPPETLILLGADHTGATQTGGRPSGRIWQGDAWQTPLGEVAVDEDLAEALVSDDQASQWLTVDPSAHACEHSIEVQVPLVKLLAPSTRILPIAMPPALQAVDAGRAIAAAVADAGRSVQIVGSTDLTHHGGHFGHPGGHGPDSESYARQNDRRMLDLIQRLAAEDVLPEAAARHNACGAGAIVATVAAARQLGAQRGRVLEYTNSYEIMHRQQPNHRDDTTVGYASVVFI